MQSSFSVCRNRSLYCFQSRQTSGFKPHLARLYSPSFSRAESAGKDPRQSQGPASKDNSRENLSSNDPQSQAAQSGYSQKQSKTPLDAASSQEVPQKKEKSTPGNPEGIGMVDQVGSQSGSASRSEDNNGRRK
ncbi:hypothetical protein GYMLUDRAFT_260041 [Collybiopsis luxurians FD-317 M1]|uniref:Uncharacterized protein n=1 Tax=Collybiopsis luxurians FD-317 M1 TaxID=944289 RepID=A0A0D0CJ64_9AGAR|nr:hypothetical protein GYMLUDRAFT_260041 [Collybiopsis luxurians FD-317 M1]